MDNAVLVGIDLLLAVLIDEDAVAVYIDLGAVPVVDMDAVETYVNLFTVGFYLGLCVCIICFRLLFFFDRFIGFLFGSRSFSEHHFI